MLDHVEAPKLMIYLEIDTDSAIKRINDRGRDYEQIVEREYWDNLNKEYQSYFKEYNLSPLLTIDASKYDLANNEDDRQYIVNLVKSKLKPL